MNEALDDHAKKDVFFNILSEKLSDDDIRRIFSFHGNIQLPISNVSTNNAKNLKTEEQIVTNFKSRKHLFRTMAAIYTTLKEIRKNHFSIDCLPDDSLLHIFSFLPFLDKLKIEKVCKRWRNISGRLFAGMKELDLRHHYHYWSKDIHYSILKQCGPFTEILKLRLTSDCEILQEVIRFCRLDHLREIHLDYCSSMRPGSCHSRIKNFFEKTQNLINLIITGALENQDISQVILLGSQTVENLKIWNTGRRDSLKINPHRFPNLREFTCRNFDFSKIQGQTSCQSFPNLERLELHNNKLSRNFIETMKLCRNLKKIILEKNVRQITANDLVSIAKNCQKIEELHLEGSFVLTARCFQEFGKMPSLQTLRIRSLGKVESVHLQHLTNLKELTISDCTKMSEHEGLIKLITNSSRLSQLSLFSTVMSGEIFFKKLCDIFKDELRVTPLILNIQVKHNNWSSGYNHNSGNPLLKLQLL